MLKLPLVREVFSLAGDSARGGSRCVWVGDACAGCCPPSSAPGRPAATASRSCGVEERRKRFSALMARKGLVGVSRLAVASSASAASDAFSATAFSSAGEAFARNPRSAPKARALFCRCRGLTSPPAMERTVRRLLVGSRGLPVSVATGPVLASCNFGVWPKRMFFLSLFMRRRAEMRSRMADGNKTLSLMDTACAERSSLARMVTSTNSSAACWMSSCSALVVSMSLPEKPSSSTARNKFNTTKLPMMVHETKKRMYHLLAVAPTTSYMTSFHASPARIWNTVMKELCSVSKLERGRSCSGMSL